MEATQGNRVGGEQVAGFGRLLIYGVVAGVAAAVANAVVYLLASALGAMPQDVVANGQPITLGAVATSSFVPAILAALLLALLGRFTRRPVSIFRIVAVVLLVVSFVTPFSIPGAPIAMIVALLLMHVVAAAVIVAVLTRFGRRGRG
ncbi:hypothetical protein GBA65_15545 [Rubrobacter marinus]|uniref:Major facilitator superfamily (MFS) profile domain-containing protein n=1 Tax=Rubrobacter marinus TaxID=2653852 RepID=A0A6G8PZR7_9ACTN|nr:DUF6069 family protein [Rubrobacter marinus]QIN79711.1 hypothetical protein GBA65_15545 [Rubrobacter marinus]